MALSAFELERAANIARRKDKERELGLLDAAAVFNESIHAFKQRKSRSRAAPAPSRPLQVTTRASNRRAGAPLTPEGSPRANSVLKLQQEPSGSDWAPTDSWDTYCSSFSSMDAEVPHTMDASMQEQADQTEADQPEAEDSGSLADFLKQQFDVVAPQESLAAFEREGMTVQHFLDRSTVLSQQDTLRNEFHLGLGAISRILDFMKAPAAPVADQPAAQQPGSRKKGSKGVPDTTKQEANNLRTELHAFTDSRRGSDAWDQWKRREGPVIQGKAKELAARYPELQKSDKEVLAMIKTYARNSRRNVAPQLKGAGYFASKPICDAKLLQLKEAVSAAAIATEAAKAIWVAALENESAKGTAVLAAAEADDKQAAEREWQQAMLATKQAAAAVQQAKAAKVEATKALNAHLSTAAQAAAATPPSSDPAAAAPDPTAAGTRKRALQGVAGSGGSSRVKRAAAAAAAATAAPAAAADDGHESISSESEQEEGLTSEAQALLELTLRATLLAKYADAPNYGTLEFASHAAYLAGDIKSGSAGSDGSTREVRPAPQGKVAITAKMQVLLMGCVGVKGMAEVLAVAKPITAVVVQGANDTAPSASIGSFVIDAVKPGLTTTSGLMHVHGEMLNAKKHGNLLSSGKSLDGWPLSGVMFREPKTGLVGSGVMARWAEQQKPGARA